MLNKLVSLYPNAIFSPNKPAFPLHNFHLFFDENQKDWLAIEKKELSEKEISILKTFYTLVEDLPLDSMTSSGQKWYDFLFLNRQLAFPVSESPLRFIQFQIEGKSFEKTELEFALKGFFSDDITIIWESATSGVIVEDKNHSSMNEKEFIALAETLESDFYIKAFFFLGKYHEVTDDIRNQFHSEKKYFDFGRSIQSRTFIFTFERVFPLYLAFFLPEDLKKLLMDTISDVLREDPEMFSTIMVFLENNLNASLTAKKLYIHRNTLQYRLDKFSDKTGIQLKDFAGAFTVFLACQVFFLSNHPIQHA
ncbi:MAG: helix-turn-helix domain-containing protein [Bacillota bacterium]|nr:helix-turn-helix domain-containing protein [Bacillota bacterium]